MTKYDLSIETQWNKNDIIRNKDSGHPYLVVHVYQHVCTILVDLEESNALSHTYTLLPRDYGNYAKDATMDLIKKNNEMKWMYNPALLNL